MPENSEDQVRHELTNIEVDTVGLVDKAANKRRFLLWKSAEQGGNDMPEEIKVESLDQAEEVMAKAETFEEAKGAFSGIVQFFKGLVPATEPEDPTPDPEPKEEPVAKTEDPRIEELIKAREEDKAELAKALERIEQAEATVQEERAKREQAEFVAKASELALPIDVQKTAELMQYVSKADPEQAAVLEDVLKSASEAMMNSGIYVEKGTTRAPQTASPFEEAVDVKKQELMSADPKMSENDAYVEAQRTIRKESPELARQYLAKRQRETK
jgi:hypothetical protein